MSVSKAVNLCKKGQDHGHERDVCLIKVNRTTIQQGQQIIHVQEHGEKPAVDAVHKWMSHPIYTPVGVSVYDGHITIEVSHKAPKLSADGSLAPTTRARGVSVTDPWRDFCTIFAHHSRLEALDTEEQRG